MRTDGSHILLNTLKKDMKNELVGFVLLEKVCVCVWGGGGGWNKVDLLH